MPSISTRVKYETLRTFNSASLTSSYQAVGAATSHDCFLIKMVNNGTTAVTVSFNGTTDHDICPATSFFLYDEQANASREGGMRVPIGTTVYVKGTAGTGTIYVVVQYAG